MSDKINKEEGVLAEEPVTDILSDIEDIAKKEGYIIYEINTTKIDTGGANYSGVLFEVDIKGKTEDGEKETNLFLKRALNDGVLDLLVGANYVYEMENYVYKDLANRFHELQSEANVPKENRYKMVKYYESSKPTIIILENLTKKAFRTPYRMDVVSRKYAELSIEQLAKFHALSFALEKKDPDYFENKVRHFRYPLSDDENAKLVTEMAMKTTIRGLDPINKAKAEKVVDIFHEKFFSYFRPESSPVTCLCHGDFKAGNILMKENEGEAVEVIPIDYQCLYIGCPIMDFLFFITCSTDRKFRVQHFENLKTLYYDTLTNFLKYFNIDSNDVFPRKEMDEIFRQRMDYVVMLAVFGFSFIFAPDNGLDMNDLKPGNVSLDERYKERLIEILEDFPV